MAADGLPDLMMLPQTDMAGREDALPLWPATPMRLGCERVLMRPVWIEGCFGWLHTDDSDIGADVAVVICPPVSWDALHSHHSLRLLADRFALAGYPTLRFSYAGTGDSRDLAADEEHWSTWQAGVGRAADWLRATTGAKRLVLAGLRLGATLATIVGEAREDVAGLLLLAPVLRGRSYMRQLALEAQMENQQSVKLDDGLEFLELQLGPKGVGRIGAVDLRRAKLWPGTEIGIFQSVVTRLEDDCTQAWVAAGANVLRGSFVGLEAMLLQTVDADPPPLEARAVLDWLRSAVPLGSSAQTLSLPAAEPVNLPGCTETPLRFGSDSRLHGILCQPLRGDSDRAVIIVNTGRDPHYGIGRFGVNLARQMAAMGIASLRFDFAGLGDSPGPEGCEDVLSALLETDRSADISAALDLLQRQGYQRIGVHGLCSGAYHAFHAALADPRIDTLLLVNFPVFRWQNVRLLLAPKHYLKQLFDGPSWGKAWRGEIKFGSIVMAQVARVWERVQNIVARPSVSILQSFPYRAMSILSQRKVRTLFLFAAGDQGLKAISQAFGRMDRGITMFDGVALRVLPGLDHVLTGRHMRETAAESIIRFLSSEDGPPFEADGAAAAKGSSRQHPPGIAA